MYEFAFEFWRLLGTEEVKVGSSVVLANESVPLLLSNAAWFSDASDLPSIATWYTERGIVPALTIPAVRSEAFEEVLRGSAFTLERSFTFRALEEPLEKSNDLLTEQVSWAQGRILGEHLAAHYGFPAYGAALGAAITAAMQRSPDIVSFAAYSADEVAGALVAFAQKGSLSAMMISGALEARLYQEAESRDLGAFVFELPEGIAVKDEASLERWSIR